jgi:integrase
VPRLIGKLKIEQEADYCVGGRPQVLTQNPGAITAEQKVAAEAWNTLYKRFYSSKASRCTPAALKQVEWGLVPLIREQVEQGVTPQAFRDEHLEIRNGTRLQEGISNNTVRQEHMLLTAMYRVAIRAKLVKHNPGEDVKMPPRVKPYVSTPTPKSLAHLLKVVHDEHRVSKNPGTVVLGKKKNVWLWRRNTAIIVLAARTGMRPAEILRLVLGDYQPDMGRIVIRVAKDREPRYVPIYSDVCQALDAWLKERPKDALCDNIFVSDRFLPMLVNTWSKEFRRYAVKAGMPGVTPRSLRHYAITEMAKTNLLAGAAAAGHTSLSTTRGYLHNDFAHTQEALAGVAHIDLNGIGDQRKTKRRI